MNNHSYLSLLLKLRKRKNCQHFSVSFEPPELHALLHHLSVLCPSAGEFFEYLPTVVEGKSDYDSSGRQQKQGQLGVSVHRDDENGQHQHSSGQQEGVEEELFS